MSAYKDRLRGFERLAAEHKAAVERAKEREAARTEYIAKLGPGRASLKAPTFSELGDILYAEGYKMHKAKSNGPDSLVVPHADRLPATVMKRVKDA